MILNTLSERATECIDWSLELIACVYDFFKLKPRVITLYSVTSTSVFPTYKIIFYDYTL
jgi:hypothetical protein